MLTLHFMFPSGSGGGLSVKTQPESRCPELLANFCDMLLRKTPYSKKLTSDEIQAKLKDVVSFLSCIVYAVRTKFLLFFRTIHVQ